MSTAKGVDTKAATEIAIPIIILAVALVAALAACAGFAARRVSAQSVRALLDFDARYVIVGYTVIIGYTQIVGQG